MARTVLITGASRGIGRSASIAFAKAGYFVAVNYNRSKQQAEELVQSLRQEGYMAAAYQADVSSRDQVERMAAEVLRDFGHIDLLINNAGIAQQKLFTDLTEQDWDTMFDINTKSMFLCCRAIVPHMIRRQQGKIINLSSIWGITGASCEVLYSATKAAVIGFTKALAKELGPSNIQVNCVAPGAIQTDMLSSFSEEDLQALREETPLERIGTPEDIANTLLFLADSRSDFITGQVISPNGGFVI